MANILTAAEAAQFVRTDTTDAVMLMLLPIVDDVIKRATGRDWTADATISPTAKAVAGMLLVQYYDNPGQAGSLITDAPLAFGVTNALAQLEAETLKYHKHVVAGLTGAGSIPLPGTKVGDHVVAVTGIYGVSGSQVSRFESVISVAGGLRQTSGSDLSVNIYVVITKSPAEDVSA